MIRLAALVMQTLSTFYSPTVRGWVLFQHHFRPLGNGRALLSFLHVHWESGISQPHCTSSTTVSSADGLLMRWENAFAAFSSSTEL